MGYPNPPKVNQVKHILILLFLLILTFPLVAQEAGVLYFKKVNGKYGWFTLEKKQVTEYKSYKIGVRALLGNTSGKASTSNSSLSLIWENYGMGFNQMLFKITSSKNNVFEMKNSSLDLSYTLDLSYIIDWTVTAGVGYVYGGKGSITSASSAIKYETESVSGFGLFGLLGMVWEGLEGLIGVRYYSTNYTDFNTTNTSEVLSLGKPYSISDAQLVFGLGYSFLW